VIAVHKSLLDLTATDLQTRVVVTLPIGMPLRDAARALAEARVHGAPVVDPAGRCVGVLSVTDVARWAIRMSGGTPNHPRTCGYQETHRSPGGQESILCNLPEGKCPFQAERILSDGRTVFECREPHTVLLEWQMVEMESLPTEEVRQYMTSEPVTVEESTPITALSRRMVNANVQRAIVVDSENRPTGIVTSTDLIAALAAAEPTRGP
jgi:predicted transcriptional regulator